MSTALTASNKETFRRLHHVLNSCDPELIEKAVDEFVAPDALIRTPLPIDATGAELAKQVWRQLLQAFPDLHVTVEDLIAEDDKVVCRNTVTGTHKGETMGLAPTGRPITYDEIFIFRFADGRIVESWGVVNIASIMRQVSIVPTGP
jgi:predicted ester cyclase